MAALSNSAIRPSVCLSVPCPKLKTVHLWLRLLQNTTGIPVLEVSAAVRQPKVAETGGGMSFPRHRDDALLLLLEAAEAGALCAHGRDADCRIVVGGQTFNCHRLVMKLTSGYLQRLLERAAAAGGGDTAVELDVPEVTARGFVHVMRFAYRGVVELDGGAALGDALAAADALVVPRLRADCVAYMARTLAPDNCVRYWSYVESLDVAVDAERALYARCRDVARSTFCRAVHSPRPLAGATEAIVDSLLRDDALQVKR